MRKFKLGLLQLICVCSLFSETVTLFDANVSFGGATGTKRIVLTAKGEAFQKINEYEYYIKGHNFDDYTGKNFVSYYQSTREVCRLYAFSPVYNSEDETLTLNYNIKKNYKKNSLFGGWVGERPYFSRSYTFHKDNTGPSFNIEKENEVRYTEDITVPVWNKNSSVKLDYVPVIDRRDNGSGGIGISQDLPLWTFSSGGTADGQTSVQAGSVLLSDGKHSFSLSQKDLFGNVHAENRILCIDSVAPGIIAPEVISLSYEAEGKYKLRLNWDPVTGDLSGVPVKSYTVYLAADGNTPVALSGINSLENNKVATDIYLNADSYEGKTVSFFIVPKDNAQNEKTIEEIQNNSVFTQYQIPKRLRSINTEGLLPADNFAERIQSGSRVVPRYTQNLLLNFAPGSYSHNAVATEGYSVTFQSEGISPISDDISTGNGVYSSVLTGEVFAHREIFYSFTTHFKDGSSYTSEPVSHITANLLPYGDLVFVDNSGQEVTDGTWLNQADLEALTLCVKDRETGLIYENKDFFKDAEGDSLNYEILVKTPQSNNQFFDAGDLRNFPITARNTLLGALKARQGADNWVFGSTDAFSGSYSFKLLLTETHNGVSTPYTDLKTLHLNYDSVAPGLNALSGVESVIFYDKNGNEISSQMTLGEEGVSVFIDPLKMSDRNGSGISSVTLINGELSGSSEVLLLGDTAVSVPWNLESVLLGEHSLRTVRVFVTDQAGNNSKEKVFQFQVDKKAPELLHSGYQPVSSSELRFEWSWGDSVYGGDSYSSWYFLQDQWLEGSHMTLSGIDSNSEYRLKVKGQDQAGNVSEVELVGYSAADVPSLETPQHDLANKSISFFMAGNSGSAGKRILRVYNDSEGKDLHEELVFAEGRFLASNTVYPNSYWYQIFCENINGDVSSGTLLGPVTVPNSRPQFTSGVRYPSDGKTLNTQGTLFWPEAIDFDGHDVRYRVTVTHSGGRVIYEDIVNTYLDLTGLEADQVYSWSVEAIDLKGGSVVEPEAGAFHTLSDYSFSVDNRSPVISLEEPLGNGSFINKEIFSLHIVDEGFSHLKSVSVDVRTEGLYLPYFQKDEINKSSFQLDMNFKEILGGKSGTLDVKVRGEDVVGNSFEKEFTGYLLDYKKPVLSGDIFQFLQSDSEYYLNNQKSFTLNLEGQDDFSGISHMEYTWGRSGQGQISSLALLKPYIGNSDVISIQPDVFWPWNDGETDTLKIDIYDHAGNVSSYFSEKPLYSDLTSPELVSVSVEGYRSVNGQNFVSSREELLWNLQWADEGSVSYEVFLRRELDNSVVPFAEAVLLDGESYSLFFQGRNRALAVTLSPDFTFVYDSSAPTDLSLTGSYETYFPGEIVLLNFLAKEPHSVPERGELTVKDASFTGTLYGNVNSVLIADKNWRQNEDGFYEGTLLFRFPENASEGVYPLNFTLSNSAGQSSSVSKDVYLRKDIDKVQVFSASKYFSSGTEIDLTWNFSRPEEMEKGEYRVLEDGQVLRDWTLLQDGVLMARWAEETLLPGKEYVIDVRVTKKDSRIIEGSSVPLRRDVSAPVFLTEDTSEAFSRSSVLRTEWHVFDSHSGVDKIELAVERFNAGVWEPLTEIFEVIGFKEKDFRLLTATGAQTGDRIRVVQRVTNGAGLINERACAPVIIDDTAPPQPVVTDNTDFINPGKNSPAEAFWMFSQRDNESETHYSWAYVKDPYARDNITWINDSGDGKAVIDVHSDKKHSETWYFLVKAENSVGLSSYGISSGITYDETRPSIASVKVRESREGKDLTYITSTENLNLFIDASDDLDKTGLTYSARYSTLNNENSYDSEREILLEENSQSSVFPVTKLESFPGSHLYIFHGEVSNSSGSKERAYSLGTLFDDMPVKVENVSLYLADTTLYALWNSTPGRSPVKEFQISLYRDNELITPLWTSAGSALNQYSVDLTSLTGENIDGVYSLSVRGLSESGLISSGENTGVSASVMVDRTAPSVSLEVPEFTSRFIESVFSLEDTGSGIEKYRYCVGTFSNPDLISRGWVERESSESVVRELIDLEFFESGLAGIPHNETLYITVMARDSAGNWSAQVRSSSILMDRTRADVLGFIPAFSNSSEELSGISIEASDAESGIDSLEVSLVRHIDAGVVYNEVLFFNTHGQVSLDNHRIYFPEPLTEGFYNLVIRAKNRAGNDDSVIISSPVEVDLTRPSFHFSKGTYGAVFNQWPVSVGFELEEPAHIVFTLEKGAEGVWSSVSKSFSSGLNSEVFQRWLSQEAYGEYQLRAVVTDRAGNTSQTGPVVLRYNAPPEIVFPPNFLTFPGKPLKLEAFSVTDPDGDKLSYSWSVPDNGRETDLNFISESVVKEFYHQAGEDYKTLYVVYLTVTDEHGKSSTETQFVQVVNTRFGELYVDEVWSSREGEPHVVNGDIFIPEAITLQVKNNTEVCITGQDDFYHGIYIGGSMNILSGSHFYLYNDLDFYWKGLMVEGVLNMEGVTLEDAERGITALETSMITVLSSIFHDNQIGLHVLSSSPLLENCQISNSSEYGVKEDGLTPNPQLPGIIFNNNRVDYYDISDTYGGAE